MATPPAAPSAGADLSPLYAHVDANEDVYVDRLREAVAIPSVSAWVDHRPHIVVMLEWAKKWAEDLGASEARMVENPLKSKDGSLPPILLVTFEPAETTPQTRTVCAYGHLDVQPARKEDGWDTEPFELTETEGGKLCGRGSSDDKGPALSWLWAIEAHRKLKIGLPVRLKLLFEGMEEYGSEGLPEFVAKESKRDGGWLADVDYFVVSDNQWLSKTTPCLTYGLRGVAYFEAVVTAGTADLHSGVYGGSVHEPLVDLIHLMGTLRAPIGDTDKMHHERIRVPGILDDVLPVTDEERKTYESLDFDSSAFAEDVKGHKLENTDKEKLLMSRWRFPTLSFHGVEGAFAEPGAKTVIPGCVRGKFSIRLVPAMEPEKTCAMVEAYLKEQWKVLGSPLDLKVTMIHGGPSWLSRTDHPNFIAASKATERVYGKPPDLVREGGSIPVANWLTDATEMNVCLLSTSACDDGAHAQNEKYNRTNLTNGIKTLATYIHEIGLLPGPRPSQCRCDPPTAAQIAVPGAFAFARGFYCKCEI